MITFICLLNVYFQFYKLYMQEDLGEEIRNKKQWLDRIRFFPYL